MVFILYFNKKYSPCACKKTCGNLQIFKRFFFRKKAITFTKSMQDKMLSFCGFFASMIMQIAVWFLQGTTQKIHVYIQFSYL